MKSLNDRLRDSSLERVSSSGDIVPAALFEKMYNSVTRPESSVVTPCHSLQRPVAQPVLAVSPFRAAGSTIEGNQRRPVGFRRGFGVWLPHRRRACRRGGRGRRRGRRRARIGQWCGAGHFRSAPGSRRNGIAWRRNSGRCRNRLGCGTSLPRIVHHCGNRSIWRGGWGNCHFPNCRRPPPAKPPPSMPRSRNI